jgi:LCP family protein required for cell wall assembly
LTTISYDDYKVIYSFDITIDEKVDTNELKDVINIYIGGFDFTDKNNDFNMLVTLNRKTKKVLLTSIPRDYYLYVPELEMSEALDYTMVWGVNLPISALENLFDIKIDYYVKIDTSSLVGIVDALGGVNFCSDTSYVTTHSLVDDTYDDSKVKHLKVTKGCKEYSGIEILTIARERLAFPDGDRQKQKNCQQIIINIVDKMTSFDSVTKYTELLDKLSDLYTTNMPSKLLTSVVKDAIDGDKWKIDTQSVDGTKGSGLIHLGTSRAWSILIPDENSVSKAKDNMKKISE